MWNLTSQLSDILIKILKVLGELHLKILGDRLSWHWRRGRCMYVISHTSMHPFILQAKLLYRSKAEKHLDDQCITALKHTQTYTHSQWFYISSEAHTVHSTEYGEWSRVDRPFRRICLRVLINLNAAIGVFIRIFVKGTQIMRSEPSETTVLSYDFIKSAIKCSLVWGGGSDKPSFFFLSDLCSSWSASCWGTVGMLVGKLPTRDASVWETQIPQGLLVMKACGYSVLV